MIHQSSNNFLEINLTVLYSEALAAINVARTQTPTLWIGLLQKIVQSIAQISLRKLLINFNNMRNYLYLNILEIRIALAFLNHKK